MKILLLDNYDSFTYNLCHYLQLAGAKVEVYTNDKVNLTEVRSFDAVVLSPGPGLPEDAGRMMELIDLAEGKIPVLGICLGMQAIALHLGGKLYNQRVVQHGVQKGVKLSASTLFKDLPERTQVGLYHSWAVEPSSGDFEVTATSDDDVVMALEHRDKRLFGVQFHPESIMTPHGQKIISNFVGYIN